MTLHGNTIEKGLSIEAPEQGIETKLVNEGIAIEMVSVLKPLSKALKLGGLAEGHGVDSVSVLKPLSKALKRQCGIVDQQPAPSQY